MVTPGSAAFVWSLTVPRIPPRNVCASSVAAARSPTNDVHRSLTGPPAGASAGYAAADDRVKVRSRYDSAVDARSRETFLASFGRCRAADGFLDAFYQRFIASSEEVRAKFAGTDMKRQVRMLEDSLLVVAVAVQGEEGSPARGDLPRIAARHSRQDLDIRPGSTTSSSSA